MLFGLLSKPHLSGLSVGGRAAVSVLLSPFRRGLRLTILLFPSALLTLLSADLHLFGLLLGNDDAPAGPVAVLLHPILAFETTPERFCVRLPPDFEQQTSVSVVMVVVMAVFPRRSFAAVTMSQILPNRFFPAGWPVTFTTPC